MCGQEKHKYRNTETNLYEHDRCSPLLRTYSVGGELSGNNEKILSLMGMWPAVAINCFIMITGYFMCTFTGNINRKILKLWSDRWFYSVSITVCMIACGLVPVSLSLILKAVLPTITCRHNYVTTFIFLYFLIPYINKCLNGLSEKEFKKLMTYSTLIMSLLPTVMGITKLWSNNTYVYLLWMIYIYCVGAFFRMYPAKLPWKTMFFISVAVVLIFTYWIEPGLECIPDGYTKGNRNNFLMLVCSVCLFNVFINWNFPEIGAIKWLSSSTFAVLLIHDDPLVRSILWKTILRSVPSLAVREDLWFIAIGIVFLVYVICAVIDKTTNRLIRKPLNTLMEKVFAQSTKN